MRKTIKTPQPKKNLKGKMANVSRNVHKQNLVSKALTVDIYRNTISDWQYLLKPKTYKGKLICFKYFFWTFW